MLYADYTYTLHAVESFSRS